MEVKMIAKLYASGLRACLDDHELMRIRNGECVANDIIDANMILHDAWLTVMGYDLLDTEGGISDSDCEIWNQAIIIGERLV